MIGALDSEQPAPLPGTPARRVAAILTVIGWVLFVALVGATYVGHSRGPYGVCYASSGRSVPCAAVARR